MTTGLIPGAGEVGVSNEAGSRVGSSTGSGPRGTPTSPEDGTGGRDEGIPLATCILEILAGEQDEAFDADGLHLPVLYLEALNDGAESVGYEVLDLQVHRLLSGEGRRRSLQESPIVRGLRRRRAHSRA